MIWLGIAALAAAGIGAYMSWSSNSKLKQIAATETSTAADLRAARESAGSGAFRQPCEITGQVLPHKNGSLRAPLSGEECVWHSHKITRKYEYTRRDSQGNRRRRTGTEVAAEKSSSTAFFVQDATGRTVVHPGGQKVTGAERVIDDFQPSYGDDGGSHLELGPIKLKIGNRARTIGFKREEWIVRPGSPFYVLGEARAQPGRGLSVNKPADGAFILSVKSETSLRRGELLKSLGFGIGAMVAAVGGVALLAVELLG